MDRRFVVLIAATIVDTVGFGIVLPLLPFYAKTLAASPFVVAIIFAAHPLAQLVAAPLLGRLSDRVGRRPLIVGGLAAAAASYLLFGLAQSIGILILSRLLLGISGGSYSVIQAYVGDITDEANRAKGMGLLGAGYGVGIVLGPALGGVLTGLGPAGPGLFAAAMSALNAAAAALLLDEPRRDAARPAMAFSPRKGLVTPFLKAPLNVLAALYLAYVGTVEAIMAVLAIFLIEAVHLTQLQAGALWAWAGLATILVRGGVVGRLAGRWGETRTIAAGLGLLIAALLGISLTKALWQAFLGVGLFATAIGLVAPSLSSLASRAAGAERQGQIMGGMQAVAGLGMVSGPLLAGRAFETLGPASPFWIASLILAAALPMVLCKLPAADAPPPQLAE